MCLVLASRYDLGRQRGLDRQAHQGYLHEVRISFASPFSPDERVIRRYLTKLCDQLVCLLSAKHSGAIVWGEDEVDDTDDASLDSEYDDADRLYHFTVARVNEQEENVTTRQGLTVQYLYSSPFSLC